MDSTAGSLVNFSSGLDEISFSRSMDPADVTNFASGGDREFIGGLRGAEFQLSGMFASTHAEIFDGIFNDATSTTYSVEYSPDGSTAAGRHLYKFEILPTGYEASASVGERVNVSFSGIVTGAVTSTNH